MSSRRGKRTPIQMYIRKKGNGKRVEKQKEREREDWRDSDLVR